MSGRIVACGCVMLLGTLGAACGDDAGLSDSTPVSEVSLEDAKAECIAAVTAGQQAAANMDAAMQKRAGCMMMAFAGDTCQAEVDACLEAEVTVEPSATPEEECAGTAPTPYWV